MNWFRNILFILFFQKTEMANIEYHNKTLIWENKKLQEKNDLIEEKNVELQKEIDGFLGTSFDIPSGSIIEIGTFRVHGRYIDIHNCKVQYPKKGEPCLMKVSNGSDTLILGNSEGLLIEGIYRGSISGNIFSSIEKKSKKKRSK